jgi:osmotically inducible protein OsmC
MTMTSVAAHDRRQGPAASPHPAVQTLTQQRGTLLRDVRRRVTPILALLDAGTWPAAELDTLTRFLRTSVLRQVPDEEHFLFPDDAMAPFLELSTDQLPLQKLTRQLEQASAAPMSLPSLAALIEELLGTLEQHLNDERVVFTALFGVSPAPNAGSGNGCVATTPPDTGSVRPDRIRRTGESESPAAASSDAANDQSAYRRRRRELAMSIAQRTALTTWEGPLAGGAGKLQAGSGALDGLDVTWAARTEQPDGKTSPEELAAAAHSSCFAMALALRLGERHTPPQRLRVEATVTLDEVNGLPTIVSSLLFVKGRVNGLDAGGFQQAVDEAAALCPVSRLFTGARISVEALLEPN